MKLERLSVLSPFDIEQIHSATLRLLATTGVEVHSIEMRNRLAAKGMRVNHDSGRVYFTPAAIEDAIQKVPRSFEVFTRDGDAAFILGDGTPRVAAGHNAVFWLDGKTGQTRPSTVEDVARFARICDGLTDIDMLGIPVMPQNVPRPPDSLIHGVHACMTNSRKPLYFSTDNLRVNRAIIEMMQAIFPGNSSEQVYGITQLSPTSPLFWEASVCEAIMDTLDTGVPIAILPEPNAGISAPLTLAGLLTVNNVECLSGIVMIQLLKPGSKVLYANSWTTTDMRSGSALVGSIETTACRIAGAQLARYYGVPSHTTAPNSDNHAHDEQNAWEKTFSQFCAVTAGNDLIVNCGMFATGMTCSHEQLIMDAEISGMCRRLAAGITVNAETIAEDLIRDIGPRGNGYLTADHTLEWLRKGEYYEPSLAVRQPRAAWEKTGALTTEAMASRVVSDAAAWPGSPVSGERAKRLNTSFMHWIST